MANQDKTRPQHRVMNRFGVPNRKDGNRLGLRKRRLLLSTQQWVDLGKRLGNK